MFQPPSRTHKQATYFTQLPEWTTWAILIIIACYGLFIIFNILSFPLRFHFNHFMDDQICLLCCVRVAH